MFNLDANTIFLSIFFSIIGFGYFSYGRRNSSVFLYCGVALMLFTYFTEQIAWVIIIGAILIIFPFIYNWLRTRYS